MNIISRVSILIAAFLLTLGATSSAITIDLHSGVSIDGEIILETDDSVTIEGVDGISVTYYFDEIKTIGTLSPDEFLKDSEPEVIREIPIEEVLSADTKIVEEVIQDVAPIDIIKEEVKPEGSMAVIIDEASPPIVDKEQILLEEMDVPSTAKERAASFQKEVSMVKATLKEVPGVITQQLDETIKVQESLLAKYSPKAYQTWNRVSAKYGKHEIMAGILTAYILFCFPIMRISQKLLVPWSYLAWIPILQLFIILKAAERPFWWIIFLFVPVINIFIFARIFMDIANYLQKSPILGLCVVIPGINIVALWLLAFSSVRTTDPKTLFDEYIDKKNPKPKDETTPKIYIPKSKDSRF